MPNKNVGWGETVNGIDIPTSWIPTSLGEVVNTIIGGGTPSKSIPLYYTGKIPWMSVKDMNKNILIDTIDHITQEAVDNSSTNIIPAGIPIVATRMSLGKIIIANFDSAINQDLKAIFINVHIDRNYFVYWYQSLGKLIESLGTGTTVKGIRLEVLKELEFPLPPLAEQKQIAAKLDELLAQVDTLKTRLDAIPAILKRFRQSVLSAAVSGRLTEEWNSKNETYYQKLSDEIEGDKKLRKIPNLSEDEVNLALSLHGETKWHRWKLFPLEQLVNSSRGIPYGIVQTGEYFEGGIPTIRCGDVKPLSLATGSLKLVKPDISRQYSRTLLAGGEVLLAIRGTVGNSAVVPSILTGCNISREVALIPVRNNVIPKFIAILLQSPGGYRCLAEKVRGVAQKGINLSDIKRFVTPLPSLEEQTQIVHRSEQLFVFAEQIEKRVKAAQSRINHLTQSILAKAFRGELTAEWRAQNPELISGEHSSESLLEKIKTERAEAAKQKKPARRAKKGNKMMKTKQVIPVINALKSAKKPLTSQQLLAEAGYPADASVELLETFFLDIREQVGLGAVTRERRGDDEILKLAD